jgi:ABC-type branched-subunit amino acid transport system permease subunit
MTLWLTLAVNSIAFGGLPFLLSAGFSLMFGLVPIANLMHGSFFMLGAYFGVTLLAAVGQFLGRGAGERPRYGDHWGGVERLYCDAWWARNSPTCLLAIRSVL